MPAPFEPVHVPFVSGARQDLGKLAQEGPSYLREAKNVLFTKRDHITNRPTAVSRDTLTQFGVEAIGNGVANNLTDALSVDLTGVDTPAGIVATGFSTTGAAGTDTPLACWQGKSYFNRNNLWEYAGVHWSLRQTKSAALETRVPSPVLAINSRGAQVSVGETVVGNSITVGEAAGAPFLTPGGELQWAGLDGLAGGDYNNANRTLTVVAGNVLFWKSGTNILAGIPAGGTGPNITELLVGTMGATGGLGACTDGTHFYIASGGGAGPGSVNVRKMTAGGAVVQTLNVVWTAGAVGNTTSALDICYDPAQNRLALVGVTNGGVVATKVLTLVAGVMADAAIDLTLTGLAHISGGVASVCCGTTHNGLMAVQFLRNATRWDTGAAGVAPGTLYVGGRLLDFAVETAITTFTGATNNSFVGSLWFPLFAAAIVAGRTLVGIMHSYDYFNQSAQWIVLDMTRHYGGGAVGGQRVVVAAGPVAGAELCIPGSVYSDGTSVSFGISEGVAFSGATDTSLLIGLGTVPIIQRAVTRRITLSVQPVQAVHAHETSLLTGQLMHVFDGQKILPHGFIEEAPYIFHGAASLTAGGGALAAGSYSYQATWEMVNGRGQVIRSGASGIVTVAGVLLNQRVTLHITVPQAWFFSSLSDFVRVRLWATQTNPTVSAPKYLVAEATHTGSSAFEVVLVHNSVSVGTEEQLYETSTTLADMRAPGADRGIAVVNERVWCADQTKLYASKLLRPNVAVSWNTEGPNTLTLPTSLGTIQALSFVSNTLVVLCSRGVAVVTGPGVDDTGIGQGWTLQILDGAPGAGESGPRSAASTAAGVAYHTQDGDVWLVGPDGSAVPISRALRNSATRTQSIPLDVVAMSATTATNALLFAQGAGGVLRVLDLEMGQWCTWEFPSFTPTNGHHIAAINGALWVQLDGAARVASVDNPTGTNDLGVGQTSATIETGTLRPGEPVAHGWGRLRSVVPNEVRLFGATPVDITMQVFADQNDRVLMNKTRTTNPNDGAVVTGGGDGALEFRTSVQRCAYARVRMTISPALFDIEGLDLWVSNTGEQSPTNNRS